MIEENSLQKETLVSNWIIQIRAITEEEKLVSLKTKAIKKDLNQLDESLKR